MPATPMVTGLGLVRKAISPATAGTSTGPSESSSVTQGLLRENPENPTSSAEPAPSITRLAAPHPTASTTGTAARQCTRIRRQPRGCRRASTHTQRP